MKQTNNAIKFLMAQYRSIFKNAYFKGLTTAMVVTAGLAAASSAQAAAGVGQTLAGGDLTATGTVTVDGSGSANSYKHVGIYDDGSALSAWNATLVITGGVAKDATGANYIISSGSGLTVNSTSGALTVDTKSDKEGLVVEGYVGATSLTLKDINVKGGILILNDRATDGTTGSGAVTVTATSINVGGGNNKAIIELNSDLASGGV